ncbi:M24 family metallopeptidase [Flaviaesturariibacter flavus]|uniref:Xaa-Pro aminopeptidase n=1 Tax=Flaviaesturariibacter flavus TaxID=2502780 RepID=A0A4R1BBE3_9BACT|nr:aminopeptidase P N-terminal domain-containing protein [Flaviaesturariibacter flavus]TCJ14310.1 M24 family metallopeptidase [Flaviaesturariibacter flavus]
MTFTRSDIDARRARLAARWNDILAPNEAVLVHCGEPIQKPGGLDQTYPFLPHPAYFWLTGRRRESEAVLYSKEGGWVEFHKEIGADEAVWEGERHDILVEGKGRPNSEQEIYVALQQFDNVYHLGQHRTPVEGKAFELRTALDRTRRAKDAAEVALIRALAAIAKSGYERIAEAVRAGVTEQDLRIAFESEILRRGATGVPYESIVGSGPNSAILHFPPTLKTIREGELVLVDAGAERYDYCVDITRMFSAGAPSQQQKDLYKLVLRAHEECIARSKAGVQWRDVHLHAARVITEDLLQLGVLKGSLDSLLEKEVSQVFFPHGVGHLVGLRVRDTGQPENINPKLYAGARLRIDLELEENFLITVEPGCYFIPALLDDAAIRSRFANDINWNEAEKWKRVGGVRIEDNILIGKNGNDNLTIDVPKVFGN